MKLRIILLLFLCYTLCSCSKSITVGFLCENPLTEIYVNDEYIGSGQVTYVAPNGTENVVVSCFLNENEVYRRNFNLKHRNGKLIELNIPKNYRYISRNSSEK